MVKNVSIARPIFPEPKYFLTSNPNKKIYLEKYFKNKKSICIEKTTSYYENKTALMKIKQNFPNAKIIMILRDPILRAISNYLFTKKNKLELRDINIALDPLNQLKDKIENVSTSPFLYLDRGLYETFLENIF